MNSKLFNSIFKQTVANYHIKNDINQKMLNNYSEGSLEYLLCKKSWIDTVQWHLEDVIRNPNIEPKDALLIKRTIDKSNQDRTDLVEKIDDYIFTKFQNPELKKDAKINTETPAWAIDRLSILNLKIFHMQEETERKDADEKHIEKTTNKLNILLKQFDDLSIAIDQLLTDLENGNIIAKTYKQMKMYNDPSMNAELRK